MDPESQPVPIVLKFITFCFSYNNVIEVLKDLGDDEDFKQLLDDIEKVKNEDHAK